MNRTLKTYEFYYTDLFGIGRVVSNKSYTLFRSLKKIPYSKIETIYKCYVNNNPVPDVYLQNTLSRIEAWHENQ